MNLKPLILLAVIALLAVCAKASDITRGATFSDGDVVTASDLHTLVDNATINPAFYTGKAVTTTPTTSVKFLIYDPASSSYKQVTLNTLLNNPAVITNQAPKSAPGTNDLVLLLDISTGLPAKATVGSVVSNGFFGVFPTYTNATTPDTNVLYLATSNGVPVATTRLDLFYQFANFATFTNLSNDTAPTNSDLLWISKYTDASKTNSYNRTQTRIGFFTNYPVANVISNTDTFVLVGSGGTTNPPYPQTATVSNLTRVVSNNIVPAVGFATTYVNFRGLTNTVGTNLTLFRSYNVSNVIRSAVGQYTVNFSNSFADTNYIFVVTPQSSNNLVSAVVQTAKTNQLIISTGIPGSSQLDVLSCNLLIYP